MYFHFICGRHNFFLRRKTVNELKLTFENTITKINDWFFGMNFKLCFCLFLFCYCKLHVELWENLKLELRTHTVHVPA
jgi:hypothetical protein